MDSLTFCQDILISYHKPCIGVIKLSVFSLVFVETYTIVQDNVLI